METLCNKGPEGMQNASPPIISRKKDIYKRRSRIYIDKDCLIDGFDKRVFAVLALIDNVHLRGVYVLENEEGMS